MSGPKMAGHILVVDDDSSILELLRMRLESANYQVTATGKEEEALASIQNQAFDLSIVDLRLLARDGISLMEDVHVLSPEMPVIIMTAHGSIESAVEAMKKGAYSYLSKPFEPADLLMQIERALENRRLTSEVKRLRGVLEEKRDFADIVAKGEKMRKVLEMVSRVAKTESTIYIHGESGTGKELIARAIHLASERVGKPFVALNCAALPETLLESELFGHEKGAFTGAIRSKKGLFAQAHEGSLFLDEIADMPLGIQAKFLRVLQERQFHPVGSEKSVTVDVRVIVASQKDLEEQVSQGLFRGDLFYRINVIPVHLPPLRERKGDIPPLVAHFLKKYNQQMKKGVQGLTPMAMQKLMLHDWPGNVRELENTVEYAVAMAREEVITEDYILKAKGFDAFPSLKTLGEARDAFVRDYLVNLLQVCDGEVSKAAKIAGKYRADFYGLMKKYSLNVTDFRKSKEKENREAS